MKRNEDDNLAYSLTCQDTTQWSQAAYCINKADNNNGSCPLHCAPEPVFGTISPFQLDQKKERIKSGNARTPVRNAFAIAGMGHPSWSPAGPRVLGRSTLCIQVVPLPKWHPAKVS